MSLYLLFICYLFTLSPEGGKTDFLKILHWFPVQIHLQLTFYWFFIATIVCTCHCTLLSGLFSTPHHPNRTDAIANVSFYVTVELRMICELHLGHAADGLAILLPGTSSWASSSHWGPTYSVPGPPFPSVHLLPRLGSECLRIIFCDFISPCVIWSRTHYLKFHHLKLVDKCSLSVLLSRLSVLGNGASAE